MGLRFDLRTANWIAHFLEGSGSIPSMDVLEGDAELLQFTLSYLSKNFYSVHPAAERELQFLTAVERYISQPQRNLSAVTQDLQRFFSYRLWTALLVPSADESASNSLICSSDFLQHLVAEMQGAPGLILQPEVPSAGEVGLADVFPAFRTALTHSYAWPGLLIWTRAGDSSFLPFPATNEDSIYRAAIWIIKSLASGIGVDLEVLAREYEKAFPEAHKDPPSRFTILQLSDLHIGSTEANQRLARVRSLVRSLVSELDTSNRIVPIITGDIMDTPSERNSNEARLFLESLPDLGLDVPIAIIGNHDVRRGGILSETYKAAMGLADGRGHPYWFDDVGIGIICFNSVYRGKLARGYIGERQLLHIGNLIEQKKRKDFTLIGVLHHHPTPVEIPDWYRMPFYEYLLGSYFTKTEELEDADRFWSFVQQHHFAAILHGHKHIPRVGISPSGNIPIYGCGSTVGKVPTKPPAIYMSINIVTIEPSRGFIGGRLLAERIPGGGLVEARRHELMYQTRFEPGRS